MRISPRSTHTDRVDLSLWKSTLALNASGVPYPDSTPEAPLVRIPVTLVESEAVDEDADGRVDLGEMT